MPLSSFSSSIDDVPASGFSSFISSILVSGAAPMSGFSSFVGNTLISSSVPVSGDTSISGSTFMSSFSFSVGRMPGSGFFSFVSTAITSDFPLHNSSRFSTLDAKLQQANKMLSQIYCSNDKTSTYLDT